MRIKKIIYLICRQTLIFAPLNQTCKDLVVLAASNLFLEHPPFQANSPYVSTKLTCDEIRR